MAITRAQLVKELLPGLNALFGLEYDRYDNEHEEIYDAWMNKEPKLVKKLLKVHTHSTLEDLRGELFE